MSFTYTYSTYMTFWANGISTMDGIAINMVQIPQQSSWTCFEVAVLLTQWTAICSRCPPPLIIELQTVGTSHVFFNVEKLITTTLFSFLTLITSSKSLLAVHGIGAQGRFFILNVSWISASHFLLGDWSQHCKVYVSSLSSLLLTSCSVIRPTVVLTKLNLG